MRTLLTVGLALSLVAVLGLSASAGAPAPAPKASPVAAGSLFDVGSEGGAVSKLTVSGELRSRWEIRQNWADFSSTAHDHQEWVDARARLGLKFELTEDTEVFLQAQTRYLWGGESGLNDADGSVGAGPFISDRDSLDLYQAYVKFKQEIFGVDTTMKIGRQEIALGSEMLLGNDSRYAGLTHDAVAVGFSLVDNLTSHLCVAKLVENSAFIAEDSNDVTDMPGVMDDTHFIGLWNTYVLNDDMFFDVYLLYVQEDDEGAGIAPFDLLGADAKIVTGGVRFVASELMVYGQKLDVSAEIAAQVGSVNLGGDDLDIQDSFAFELEAGWRPDLPWSPRLALGFAWASGDDDATDGNCNHFVSLFQDTEGRLGKSDMFVLENIRCAYIDLTCKPLDKEELDVGITYLKFNAFEEGDTLGIGGQNLGPSNVNDVGDEIDLYASYAVNSNIDAKLCWSYLEPDDQVHDTAGMGNSPAHRVHLTLVVKF